MAFCRMDVVSEEDLLPESGSGDVLLLHPDRSITDMMQIIEHVSWEYNQFKYGGGSECSDSPPFYDNIIV